MLRLKSIRLPSSANFKLSLVLFATIIVAGTLLYTQQLVEELKVSERKTMSFYAKTLQKLVNTNADNSLSPDIAELAFEIGSTIHFPLIITDAEGNLFEFKNIDIDTTATQEAQQQELAEHIDRMADVYDPLPIYIVTDSDSIINNWVFYNDSETITQLRWLPYVELLIGAMFILVGYIGFSHVKRTEQSNIWVGMAKETAHQLGTPLSSLMGWVELLRYMPEDPKQVLEAADEMEHDVERLNKVAQRFSKIGSPPELKPVELNRVLHNVVSYFERRLPHLGKTVTLSLDEEEPVYASVNVGLLEWVFENLVRNAADAIDRKEGTICFRLRQVRDHVMIEVSDNGRGIDPKIRQDIFRPGFSTKQRGWGLGLSLARRIVEEYHGGKISIKHSSPEGTTFAIRLNTAPPPADGGGRTEGNVEHDASTADSEQVR